MNNLCYWKAVTSDILDGFFYANVTFLTGYLFIILGTFSLVVVRDFTWNIVNQVSTLGCLWSISLI